MYENISSLDKLNSLTLSANEEYLNSNRLMELILNCYNIQHLKLYHYEISKPTLTDDLISVLVQDMQSSLKSMTIDCTYLTSYSYDVRLLAFYSYYLIIECLNNIYLILAGYYFN